MSTSEFGDWLAERDATLVYTFINVSEFADCFAGVNDLLYIRSILQALERLPHCYLKEITIEAEEIEAAVTAFDQDMEPSPIDPYVPRWDYTLAGRHELPRAHDVVAYRLDSIVFDLMMNRDARRRGNPEDAVQMMIEERALPSERRKRPVEALQGVMEHRFAMWQISPPTRGSKAFAKWVYADPARCPGLRLGWELFRSLVGNKRDALTSTDVFDYAHFPAIPYVDYVTFDRRMCGYAREIAQRLVKQNEGVDYRRRLFRSLSELLHALS